MGSSTKPVGHPVGQPAGHIGQPSTPTEPARPGEPCIAAGGRGRARVVGRVIDGADLNYQQEILQGVSRTFALTIPALPGPLCLAVGNAYLLCRLADTVEDEPGLAPERKRELAELFARVVAGDAAPESFSAALAPLLTSSSLPAEHELVVNAPRVLRVTYALAPGQRRALERCVRIMSAGMADFQEKETLDGLSSVRELDRYCYHVAGVVGEMLTELFCEHSADMARTRGRMLELAVSFGQGLQMTNILKDIWDDRARGACWLPRDVFAAAGFDLARMRPGIHDPAFAAGMRTLVGIARGHLHDALRYTLMVPAAETGIRRFCLWALGMAVLTLRKINANPCFSAGHEVKISRRSVRATVGVTSAVARSDTALSALFALTSRGLSNGSCGADARNSNNNASKNEGHPTK